MWQWFSRCVPGFSILALLLLLFFGFFDGSRILLPLWVGSSPPAITLSASSQNPLGTLNPAQKIFVVWSCLVHISALLFTVRLSFSLHRVYHESKAMLQRRFWQEASTLPGRNDPQDEVDDPTQRNATRHGRNQTDQDLSLLDMDGLMPSGSGDKGIIFDIIVPNYCEDIDTLRTTLSVLASHPKATSQYEIYLAMEEKETQARDKAAALIAIFQKAFLNITSVFHPAGLPGEIAGKGSNVAFAARQIMEYMRADPYKNRHNHIITVMDADTHLTQDYFREIHRMHTQSGSDSAGSFYSCPIIFDRNANETPVFVRCADLLWTFAGLSTMHPDGAIAIPTSVYSIPLVLAEKVGGWDGDATAIGEDMHMLLKCYFETGGAVQSRVIYSPASQCNISGDPVLVGWRRIFDICKARYRQAMRHMWGSLDTGYAIRKSVAGLQNFNFATSRRQQRFSLFSPSIFRTRQLALLNLLWEAHFLPAHLTIILLFSVAYTSFIPAPAIHPTLDWMFWFTGLLRGMSFVWMNVCIGLYDRWHALCLNSRMRDMEIAGLLDTGFSPRVWWHHSQLLERIGFPVAGTIFGSIPSVQAVFSHFWTDQLVYRVSKKPVFANSSTTVAGV